MLNGRQYIVVAVGGGGVPGELVAFRTAGSADDELGPDRRGGTLKRPPATESNFFRELFVPAVLTPVL
jgi:hypothetical protein